MGEDGPLGGGQVASSNCSIKSNEEENREEEEKKKEVDVINLGKSSQEAETPKQNKKDQNVCPLLGPCATEKRPSLNVVKIAVAWKTSRPIIPRQAFLPFLPYLCSATRTETAMASKTDHPVGHSVTNDLSQNGHFGFESPWPSVKARTGG
ncbi:hypothetical protein ElyMa_003097100 [Elysia marginata]|uniref:CTNNB1 binding N-teminal domain-containing protein n=1 Tax=Elysia marginata TaxID=1093978 RepID=A0AAV4IMJ5_9GAST|nr:hypothetical protein ElyMa_003097100 [Elysia marginata]